MNENYKSTFKKPCPKHLEGNLKENKFKPELISLYWKATNAKTKFQFDAIMNKITETPNGNRN